MGVYLSIVAGAIKLFNYLARGLQQHHDEVNGKLVQMEATRAATEKELEAVAGPFGDAECNRLWLENRQKFGPDGQPGGQQAAGLPGVAGAGLERRDGLDETV